MKNKSLLKLNEHCDRYVEILRMTDSFHWQEMTQFLCLYCIISTVLALNHLHVSGEILSMNHDFPCSSCCLRNSSVQADFNEIRSSSLIGQSCVFFPTPNSLWDVSTVSGNVILWVLSGDPFRRLSDYLLIHEHTGKCLYQHSHT